MLVYSDHSDGIGICFGILSETSKVRLCGIYGVYAVAYLLGVFCNVHMRWAGNPKIDEMGIDQSCGTMEGKETRLGPGTNRFVVSDYDKSPLIMVPLTVCRQHNASFRYGGDVGTCRSIHGLVVSA